MKQILSITIFLFSHIAYSQPIQSGVYLAESGINYLHIKSNNEYQYVLTYLEPYFTGDNFKEFRHFYNKIGSSFRQDSIQEYIKGIHKSSSNLVGEIPTLWIDVIDSTTLETYTSFYEWTRTRHYKVANDSSNFPELSLCKPCSDYWKDVISLRPDLEERIIDCHIYASIYYRFEGMLRFKNIAKYLREAEDLEFWQLNRCPEAFTDEAWEEIINFALSEK